MNFRWTDGQDSSITTFSGQLRTKEWTQRLQTGNITVDIDEGIMANIKKLDFFQLNVQKNSDSAKARACRNPDFWDGAGIYRPSLHADDPEAMFRGEIALLLPVD